MSLQNCSKGNSRNPKCCNCHDQHLIDDCPWPACIFCFETNFKGATRINENGKRVYGCCEKKFCLTLFDSLNRYQKHAKTLYENANDYNVVLDQLKAEKPSYNILSKEWVQRFISLPFDDLEIREYATTEDVIGLKRADWRKPFKILDARDIAVSSQPFGFQDILKCFGDDAELDVIDVYAKLIVKMSLKEFVDEFAMESRPRTLNSISYKIPYENPLLKCPDFFSNISWEKMMPVAKDDKVEYLCYLLMSMESAFTNFHSDYSGTSAFTFCYSGEKIWYFLEPDDENVGEYAGWDREHHSNPFILKPKLRNKIKKVTLREGECLFIPSGYFHAVFTSKDAICLGGNCLNSFNIPNQIKIHEIDYTKAASNFYVHNFEQLHMEAAYSKFKEFRNVRTMPSALKRINEDDIEDFTFMSKYIPEWLKREGVKKKATFESMKKNMDSFFDILKAIDEMKNRDR